MLLLQLLGVGVELEAGGLRRLQNDLAGFFTDIGLIVQNPGNRADGIAGLCGKILNGHSASPTVKNDTCKRFSRFSITQAVKKSNLFPQKPRPPDLHCGGVCDTIRKI